MKIIVAGSRTFDDYDLLKEKLDYYLQHLIAVEIVSGAARGADELGERYAVEKGYPIKRFLAEWKKYGKSAGFCRNAEMAAYAQALILFWDGSSPGSANMLKQAKEKGLMIREVKI